MPARIPIVVISLARSHDRRKAMSEHMDGLGLGFAFHDAVDGTLLAAELAARLRPEPQTFLGRPFSAGELGLAGSYLELCTRIAAGGDEFVCVLEDDARLTGVAVQALDPGFLRALPDFDVLRLGHDGLRGRHGYVTVGRVRDEPVVAPVMHRALSHGQVFTRRGAALAARGLVPLKGPVDWHLYAHSGLPLRILQTTRSVVEQGFFDSTIQTRPAGEGTRQDEVSGLLRRAAIRRAKIRARRHYREAWGTWMYLRARFLAG